MIDLGSVPDWMAATATTLALFVTVIVIVRERSDRVWHLARHVSAWSEWNRDVPGAEPRQFFGYLRNTSESPVFDCLVTATGTHGEEVYLIHVVPAHETSDYGLSVSTFPPSGEPPLLEARFLDVTGRRWVLSAEGHLTAAR